MTELTATRYGELVVALRARIAELGITYATVDEIAGFPLRYTSKLLGDSKPKKMGVDSLFALAGSLGVKLRLEDDAKALKKHRESLQWMVPGNNGARAFHDKMLHAAEHRRPRAYRFRLSSEHFRRLQALSTRAKMAKQTPAKRRKIAKKAAVARWARREMVKAGVGK